jgi:hypothetical protein
MFYIAFLSRTCLYKAISVNVAVNSCWILIVRRVWKYKRVILIRKSKKDRQHNGQAKKDERTSNDLQKIQVFLSIIIMWRPSFALETNERLIRCQNLKLPAWQRLLINIIR